MMQMALAAAAVDISSFGGSLFLLLDVGATVVLAAHEG
jgi:hypothetical protein